MANHPSTDNKDTKNTVDTAAEPPAPEVLQPQADEESPAPEVASTTASPKATPKRLRRTTYRPSHKATFIGLSVVVAVLAVNAVIITFLMNGQEKTSAQANNNEVTISPAVLDGLGVSRNPVGNAGTELTVGPNSHFNGKVTIGDDVTIAGQLNLNSKFSATDASLTKLQAGDTSLGQLNVNGDGTMTSLNLRKDLRITGLTLLQGPVTMGQLLTVNNSVNVAGNLAVGGTLSARGFQASSLVSDTTLTIGGHVITRGAAPGVGPGSALGNNGTVSISGNDASGTVAANIGTNAGNGILAYIAFRNQYGTMPHVVITAVGRGADGIYVVRSIGGFSIGVTGALAPGGYAFDYIVMQ